MVVIDIPDQLLKRLEKYANFVDNTPAAVIQRAVDALDALQNGAAAMKVLEAKGSVLASHEALRPPDLTFTKVIGASFNGIAVKPANWSRLLDIAVTHAAKEIGDFDKLRRILTANVAKGEKTDEGYHFLPGANLSVQGQDANDAWRCVMMIAKNLKCSVEVSFLWRNKEGAAYPGEPGTMRFG
jgi:hypothetical protein